MFKILPAAAFILSFTLVNNVIFADSAENNSQGNSVHVTKDNWLTAIIPLIPDRICKELEKDESLKKRADEINMSYQKCITVIPESISKCQKKISDKIPDNIDMDKAAELGKSLGDCIGNDFFNTYFIPKQK